MNNKNIYVNKPYLPPLEEFMPYLESIWQSKILTNGGPFHQILEKELCAYLGVKNISLFTNATIALVTAIQALELSGEVITTPFSFVATTHSLLWNKIKPVFVDIDPLSLNLNPEKIEEAITEHTTAIMPVHVYGNPADVDKIKKIADKYKIKVIYDAAHAFGVKDLNGSILNHGDLSIISFHATKVFNTFEGGAIICHDEQTKNRIDQLKNFGIIDEVSVVAAGINGKMSEINAAIGILQLKYIDHVIELRKKIGDIYREKLKNVKGIICLEYQKNIKSNYSYFPILVKEDYNLTRDELYYKLKEIGINSRRYFYPLISKFPMYSKLTSAQERNLPIANVVAMQILCLPIYPELDTKIIQKIINIINE